MATSSKTQDVRLNLTGTYHTTAQEVGVEDTTAIVGLPDPSRDVVGEVRSEPLPAARTIIVQTRPYRLDEDGVDYLASTASVTVYRRDLQ